MRRLALLTAFFLCFSAAYSAETGSELSLAAVLESLSLKGTPYILGGTGPRGLDCSGLVYFIYSPEIKNLPRRAIDQYKFGTPVLAGKEEPGDLVFFNTEGWSVSHVGIYLGNNRFVHAASGTNTRGTVVSSLTSPYYAKRYMGARRLINPD